MKRLDSVLFVVAVLAFGAWWYLTQYSGDGSDTAAAGTDDDMIRKIANLIAQFEGSKATDLNHRTNNPGNLEPPGGKSNYFPGQTGVYTNSNGTYATFGSWEDGMNALIADLKHKFSAHPDWSVQDLFSVWLGGKPGAPAVTKEGNPFTYAAYVAKQLGVSVSTTLGQLKQG